MIVKVFEKLNSQAKAIRLQVFVEEQGFVNEFDDIDNRAWHLIMYHDKMAIATCRLYFDSVEKAFYLGRIAVIRPWRSHGIGKRLIKAALILAKEQDAKEIYLSAQQRVQGFYEKLGFNQIRQPYLDEAVPHVLMVKERD